MKIKHSQVESHVVSLEPFESNNLFGVSYPNHGLYVVYSYGTHYPLYIHDQGQWYGNDTYYSQTTGRHRSIARPSKDIIWLDTSGMDLMLEGLDK